MVYSNIQIREAIEKRHIICVPFNPRSVSQTSLDLTLGSYYYSIPSNSKTKTYNPFDEEDVASFFKGPQQATPHQEWCNQHNVPLFKNIPSDHPIIVLKPLERILAHSHEFVGIKPPGTWMVKSRSTWARNGLAVCFDAGWIDPGYVNRITFELFNLNTTPIVLPVGERIAQGVFMRTGDVQGAYCLDKSRDSGKYHQELDVELTIKNWAPEQILPKAYSDKRILPQPLPFDTSIKTNLSQPQKVSEILQEKLESPYVQTNENGMLTSTVIGKEYLDNVITNTEDSVYVFTDKLSPTTIAAALARFSRRGDDMRITILDEFSNAAGKDEKLLQRVITAYGDDSVQQLAGLHLVVEGASNLLTKKLEWGRLAAYLEQSTRYINFDQKDARGNYKYYTPTTLDAKSAQNYEATMNRLFDLYSNMVRTCTEYIQKHSVVPEAERDGAWKSATRAQACDAIRPVLPVATKSTVGIFASGQALESLIMHLQSDELAEARETGDKMLFEARKVTPAFLERADKPDRGGAMIAYRINTRKAIQELIDSKLSSTHSTSNPPTVTLSDVFPHNELDLLPHMLYERSHLSLQELEDEIASWSYKDKVKAFQTYIGERLNRRHKPGRAIEFAHYTFDLVCDYGIFRDLQRHRMVDELEWQSLTPRYGYEVPKLVDDSGLTEKFEQCFDLSLKLYSSLQAAGYEMEAQYATLLGHKMRWKLTYNAREAFHLHELRTSPQGHPGYRKLVQEMHEKVAEAHPMLAEGMRFVNQGEDPELSRLAAERYTQMKLKQLNK